MTERVREIERELSKYKRERQRGHKKRIGDTWPIKETARNLARLFQGERERERESKREE